MAETNRSLPDPSQSHDRPRVNLVTDAPHTDASAIETSHSHHDRDHHDLQQDSVTHLDHQGEACARESPPDEDERTSQAVENRINEMIETIGAHKKKKKRKPKAVAPTGFEEYYADPPVTPEEAGVEDELYCESRSVEARILTAVQRWTSRRKFDEQSKEIFDRWLKYGGINTGPKMFVGGIDASMEDMDSVAKIEHKATQALDKSVHDGSTVVDFDAVLKGFLSCNSATYFTLCNQGQLNKQIQVLDNFFNYLILHNVCSEYNDQIIAAKATLKVGQYELNMIRDSASLLPGPFNVACSTLFGGWYYGTYNDTAGWGQDGTLNITAMSVNQASACFVAGFACQSTDEMVEMYQRDTQEGKVQPLRRISTGLEVIAKTPPTGEMNELYEKYPTYHQYRPVGVLAARTWRNPAAYLQDLTEEEEKKLGTQEAEVTNYEFWLEEDILDRMFVGMKFEADVYLTTWGTHFFDQVSSTCCSFFSWLPNDQMEGWRDHVYLPPRDAVELPQLQAFESIPILDSAVEDSPKDS